MNNRLLFCPCGGTEFRNHATKWNYWLCEECLTVFTISANIRDDDGAPAEPIFFLLEIPEPVPAPVPLPRNETEARTETTKSSTK